MPLFVKDSIDNVYFAVWKVEESYEQLVGILGIGLNLIGNLLALLEGLEAVAHDGGEVDEHVVAALVVGDEAEALGLVEPLDSTVIHNNGTSCKKFRAK